MENGPEPGDVVVDGGTIRLASIGAELAMSDVYADLAIG